MTQLTIRQVNILTAVIEQHIASHTPVSSGVLAASYRENGRPLSSASIRNTLHLLEEAGCLEKPHLSSGRVPTRKGYRCYVNRLIATYNGLRSPDHTSESLGRLAADSGDTRTLLVRYLDFLREQTGCASFLLLPDTVNLQLNRIEFVRLADRRILAVLLSRSGLYRQSLIELDRPVSYEELATVANYLNRNCHGKTLFQIRGELIRSMRDRVEQLDETMRRILDAAYRFLASMASTEEDLVVRGISSLLNEEEWKDVQHLQKLVSGVEEKHRMMELVSACLDQDVSVMLEGESASSFSMVVSPYGIGHGVKGAFGILGPIRLDYRRAMSTMKLLTENLMGTIIKRSMQQSENT